MNNQAELPDPTDRQVIILAGEFAGEEGYCLGRSEDDRWAVTPHSSNRVLNLRFDSEFAIILNPSQPPGRN